MEERWPISPETRKLAIDRAVQILSDPKARPRAVNAAQKILAVYDKLNLEEAKIKRGTDGLDQLAGAIARELRSPGLAGESRGTITSDSHTVSLRSLEQSREVAAGEAPDPDLPLGG